MTTMQDLATISEVCAGFNIIVTCLLSCLINASECIQNVSLRRKFKKKIMWRAQPLPRPSPVGERIPLPIPHRRLRRLDTRIFGARPRLDKFRKSNPTHHSHRGLSFPGEGLHGQQRCHQSCVVIRPKICVRPRY